MLEKSCFYLGLIKSIIIRRGQVEALQHSDVPDKPLLLLIAECDYLIAHYTVRVRAGEDLVFYPERIDFAKLYLYAFGVDRVDIGLASGNVAFRVETLQSAD